MIAVDFIEVTYHLFKSHDLNRVQFGEIEPELLPRKGDSVVIGSSQFIVEQVTFYPFGDSVGKKGARVYIRRQ
jgi:hypothetical protein